jgi:hypothetical protein
MRRTLPGHFTLRGKPKKPLTQAEAEDAAVREHKKPYRCDFCGHWHIGGHRERGKKVA